MQKHKAIRGKQVCSKNKSGKQTLIAHSAHCQEPICIEFPKATHSHVLPFLSHLVFVVLVFSGTRSRHSGLHRAKKTASCAKLSAGMDVLVTGAQSRQLAGRHSSDTVHKRGSGIQGFALSAPASNRVRTPRRLHYTLQHLMSQILRILVFTTSIPRSHCCTCFANPAPQDLQWSAAMAADACPQPASRLTRFRVHS